MCPAGSGGGLTPGLTLAGEIGPEWIVPTYEPQRSRFLSDVGVDPEAEIGDGDCPKPCTLSGKAQGGRRGHRMSIPTYHLDGREVCHTVAKGTKQYPELVNAIREAIQ